MGRVIDQAGIQFRMLNASRGRPCAVRGRRRTAALREAVQALLSDYPNLTIVERAADDLLLTATAGFAA